MANTFNFAREPFRNERLPRLVFGLVATIVLSITVVHGVFLGRYLLREGQELDARVDELRERVRETEAEIARTQTVVSQEQTVLRDERTRFLTRLYRRKSFSWTGLFNELETILPAPARVTSIAPFEEKSEISVTVTLVGRTLQDVLETVRQLEASSFFATVFPIEEANLDERAGNDTGIAATLRLRYVAPEESEPKNLPAEPETVSHRQATEAIEP